MIEVPIIKAYKPNTSQKNRVAYCINLDWLQFMCSGELVYYDNPEVRYCFGTELVLVQKEMGTRLFKYGYEVFLKDKSFGAIYCSPRSKILERKLIQFKLNNNVLYEAGFLNDFKKILLQLKWEVKNVSRVDIAIDGGKPLRLINQFVSGKIEKLGKAKVKHFLTGKAKSEGFDVGSKASNKWITGYLKSPLLETEGKNYIKDFWVQSGLNINEPVERLELKIRNEQVKLLKDFDWRKLDKTEYLAGIFKKETENFFEFVKKSKSKNISRRKRNKTIQFIDWRLLKAEQLERLSTQQSNEVHRMKQAIKTNYFCFLEAENGAGEKYKKVAEEMVQKIRSEIWFMVHVPKWEEEFEKQHTFEFLKNKKQKAQDDYMNFEKAKRAKQYK